MIRKYVVVISMLFFVIPSVFCVFGDSGHVRVTIPDFPVTVNGAVFDDQYYSEYPLLRYNDIVYFPLTYLQTPALNIETEWTAEKGLVVSKCNPETPRVFSYYETQFLKEDPWIDGVYWQFQMASISNSKITINGKEIDHRSEPYPFLHFRGVNYFPLTWKYVVDELGCSYSFDEETGLTIGTDAFFYTANGDSSINDDGSFSSIENETHYVKGDLRISIDTKNARLLGPMARNLSIVSGGTEIRPEGYFGYYQKNGPLFTVEGDYIYTVYYTHPDIREVRPCKINIQTGEILDL